MSAITIGGRVLDVPRETLGFRKHKLLPWRASAMEVKDPAADIEVMLDGILLFVGHHDGVTREWLEDHATGDTLIECMRASQGVAAVAPVGEAKGP